MTQQLESLGGGSASGLAALLATSVGRRILSDWRRQKALPSEPPCLALYTGKWPKLQIDYVNRNGSDTCWANLRLVTPAQKRVNAHTTSKLGVKGVWITPGGKYAARIKVAGKITYLGSFDTTKEAGAAYAKAAKRAYGKFARER